MGSTIFLFSSSRSRRECASHFIPKAASAGEEVQTVHRYPTNSRLVPFVAKYSLSPAIPAGFALQGQKRFHHGCRYRNGNRDRGQTKHITVSSHYTAPATATVCRPRFHRLCTLGCRETERTISCRIRAFLAHRRAFVDTGRKRGARETGVTRRSERCSLVARTFCTSEIAPFPFPFDVRTCSGRRIRGSIVYHRI